MAQFGQGNQITELLGGRQGQHGSFPYGGGRFIKGGAFDRLYQSLLYKIFIGLNERAGPYRTTQPLALRVPVAKKLVK
jgi:hypothetical protein